MPYDESAKNLMLGALDIDTVSLHSGDPGSAADNELSGGSPAYARQSIGYAAAASSARDSNVQPQFDIPAGATVAWVGFWSGATRRGKKQLAVSENFAAQGTYTLTDSDLTLTDAP